MRQEIKDRIEKIRNGEVPEGYKKINNVIIPLEWKMATLKEYFDFKNGINFRRNERGLLIEVLGVADFSDRFYADFSNLSYTQVDSISGKVTINKGDLLFVRSNGNKALIGRVMYVDNIDRDIYYSGFIIKGSCSHEDINNEYIARVCSSQLIKKQYLIKGGGSNINNLNQEILSNLQVYLPDIKEQNRIVDLLATWDKAIELKEQLIEQKKEQKRGLMKKLLTGEVRLPGFDGKWKRVRFMDCLQTVSVKKYQIKSSSYSETGMYPVVDQSKKKIVAYSDNSEKVFKCPEPGVIVFGDHTRELKYIDFDFIVGADGTQVLKSNDGFDIKFLYYQLALKEIPNTGYNRHFKFLKEMVFEVPNAEEQKAISKIISTLDLEIDLLEQELEALKLQKKGLMQLLLTGIVRVPN